jgi:Stage II sporulation protein E (SpoIIE)
VLHRPGTATTFLLGDVCGKGVDAAVSTGRVRQSVLALRRVEGDPVRLL